MYSESELIILGDFNSDWSSAASGYIKEVSSSLNLAQLITEPTRHNLLNPSKSTTIDLIFSNKPDKIIASGVFDLGVSDHCLYQRHSPEESLSPHCLKKE